MTKWTKLGPCLVNYNVFIEMQEWVRSRGILSQSRLGKYSWSRVRGWVDRRFDDDLLREENLIPLVFVFRREGDAVAFKLRFCDYLSHHTNIIL